MPKGVPNKSQKATKKTTDLSTALRAAPVGTLVPTPHGGALRNGGTNKGGKGATPSEIRAALRQGFEARIPTLARLADNALKERDQLAAIDLMGKYGLGTTKEITVEQVRSKVAATIETIRHHLKPAQAERILTDMRAIWA